LTASLRMQTNPENAAEFKTVSNERCVDRPFPAHLTKDQGLCRLYIRQLAAALLLHQLHQLGGLLASLCTIIKQRSFRRLEGVEYIVSFGSKISTCVKRLNIPLMHDRCSRSAAPAGEVRSAR
jgi:ribosomal protein S14